MPSNFYPKFKILAFLILLVPAFTKAQSTYSQVYQLIQAHCGTYTCHDGSAPTFNATLPAATFYSSIINGTPVNPAAAANFNKLIVPGDVQHSFMLRKMAHGISSGLALTGAEGADMPSSLPALANHEIELLRQWILFGAPDTGTVVDTALINTYYRKGGIDDTYSPHDAPLASQGFQIYCGKIFIPPATEKEYFIKYNPHFQVTSESPRMDFFMPATNHHFVLYNFITGADVLYKDGLRPLSQSSQMNVTSGAGARPGYTSYVLPTGLAYFCDQGLIYDLNLHIKNPSPDSILATDLYANVYLQTAGTAHDYMLVQNYLNDQISIPQDNQTHTYTMVATDSAATKTWKFWKLYTHTHRYGTDFKIWLRNADGSKGNMIYDGFYNYELGFNAGYYRWGTDVTVRTWPGDSLFEVNPRLGLIYEATYKNTAGPNPTIWGETSMDEMMVTGFQYIPGSDLTSVPVVGKDEAQTVRLFPNPTNNGFTLSYELGESENIRVDLTNMLGEKSATLIRGLQTKGSHNQTFNAATYNLSSGIYFITFTAGEKTSTQKLIIQN